MSIRQRDHRMATSHAEEYLIQQSLCDDPFRAEAWLITAKTLFPHSFAIQFAMYDMYKETHRCADAARELANLMSTFAGEKGLATEMKAIAGTFPVWPGDLQIIFPPCNGFLVTVGSKQMFGGRHQT